MSKTRVDVPQTQACGASPSFFTGSGLVNCAAMGTDIKACQATGKIVTLSLGGATASAGFTSASQAQGFADQIWDLFLGGSSATRPFGDAVLDGIDLDITSGSSQFYDSFVTQLRTHFKGAAKKCVSRVHLTCD